MRVGLLVGTSARTGVETHLKMLVRALAQEGATPFVVCPRPGPLTEELTALGFEVLLEAPRGRMGGIGLVHLARALRSADVVHAHGSRALYWSALVRFAAPRRPAVGTVHEYGLTGSESPWRSRVYPALERRVFRAHDRLIAVSKDLAQRVVLAGAIPAERMRVIPNASEFLLQPPRALPVPFTARAVVAARADRVKGLDVLLDAWAILAQGGFAPPLLVLGEGIERPGLERRAQELGLGGVVRFLGSVPDAPALMANEGFYVAPSRYEGLPGSVVEAMALGLPVVATAVGGHLDLLLGSAPEWLVPPEDPAALAARVKDLLALAPPAREALSRRLQETAYRDFAPAGIARATLEVYRAAGARGA